MAPPQWHEIERNEEWENFMKELEEFHAERGTRFDREPKVTQVSIDLLKLYKYVIDKGGYDALAVEKNVWLKVANDLGIGQKTGVAFNLKTAYYKNLVAYEITKYHKKTPPPKSILEDLTAAGGDVLSRTIDNFHHKKINDSAPVSREASHDVGTPNRDTKAEDGGGTPTSIRAARGLRSQPPQTQRFQPESGPRRTPSTTSRHPSNQQPHAGSSASIANNDQAHQRNHLSRMDSHAHSNGHLPPSAAMGRPPSHNMNANYASSAHASQGLRGSDLQGGASARFSPEDVAQLSSNITNFQPPQVQPLPLRPVETPANAPGKFAKKPQLPIGYDVARQAPHPSCFSTQPSPLDGPNIYVRCLQSLNCPIPSEQEYAVHHLLKISYERGDRYKFDGFPGLSDGLAAIVLRVGGLYYDIEWTVCNDPDADGTDPGALDGIYGTSDILERIANLTPRAPRTTVKSEVYCNTKGLATEAFLTFRNMIMLAENAAYLAEFAPLQDLICIVLHLPNIDDTVELKHIALEIAEQLTPGLVLESHDPLYKTLLLQLYSNDRGVILTSLHALTRASINLEQSNKLADVPLDILARIIDWLMLGDAELLEASMDFLYQYTAVVSNLDNLLRFRTTNTPGKADNLIKSLARLLSHGAKVIPVECITKPEVKLPYSEEVAALPRDLQDRLLAMEEPERCYAWLRILFEEDSEASITQIAIWTAYQSSFSTKVSQMGKNMISPADFIRNVNHVWTAAGAQIIRGPNGESQKFIIKGIRARYRPVDPDTGKDYFRCLWSLPGPQYQKCNLFHANAEKMHNHILDDHLFAQKQDGSHMYANVDAKLMCFWAGCRKWSEPTDMKMSELSSHIKTHVKEVERVFHPRQPPTMTVDENGKVTCDLGSAPSSPNPDHKRAELRPHTIPAKSFFLITEETATTRDERNVLQPAGISLNAALIMRNIARNVIKTEAQEELLKEQEKQGVADMARGWNEILFRAVRRHISGVMTINSALAPMMSDLLDLIREK